MKITTVVNDYSLLTSCIRRLADILCDDIEPEIDQDGHIVIRTDDGSVIGWAEIDDGGDE